MREFVEIQIKQVPNDAWKTRNKVINLDFVNEYYVDKGWEKHTDCARFTLPKNIILDNGEYLFSKSGTYNVVLGGIGGNVVDSDGNEVSYPPLIMKGDIVTINNGYYFTNENGQDVKVSTGKDGIPDLFKGFVSRVHSKTPIEVECEDNFYLLKRTPVNKSVWDGSMVDLCKYMIDQVNDNFSKNKDLKAIYSSDPEVEGGISMPTYKEENPYPELSFTNEVDDLVAKFTLGHLDIGDVTCAQLLSRLQSQYHLESFFVGDVLHFGFPIYSESRANSNNFFFFEDDVVNGVLEASANIFDSPNLEYSNKDDIQLSTVVSCKTITKTGKKTLNKEESTKIERLSVLVYWDIATQSFKYKKKNKGEPFPKNEGGERHDCIYAVSPNDDAPSYETLFNYGVKQLEKYMYDGFKGCFTTFGYPFVNWNDNVNLVSKSYADRNGQYKVKKVRVFGGNGIKQEVHIAYKINVNVPNRTKKIVIG